MPTTTRGYPYPNPGDPANVPADMQALATAIDTDMTGATLLVQSKLKVANTTANSTTEVFIDSITFTAVTGETYLLMIDGNYQGTTVADILEHRFRWAAGASVTAAGTLFGSKRTRIEVANSSTPFSMHRTVTGVTAGQATIGVSINRQSGAGTVQVDGAATNEFVMTLLRVVSP